MRDRTLENVSKFEPSLRSEKTHVVVGQGGPIATIGVLVVVGIALGAMALGQAAGYQRSGYHGGPY